MILCRELSRDSFAIHQSSSYVYVSRFGLVQMNRVRRGGGEYVFELVVGQPKFHLVASFKVTLTSRRLSALLLYVNLCIRLLEYLNMMMMMI